MRTPSCGPIYYLVCIFANTQTPVDEEERALVVVAGAVRVVQEEVEEVMTLQQQEEEEEETKGQGVRDWQGEDYV